MSFEYLHPNLDKKTWLYNRQLMRWLIARGFIPKDKDIKILDLASGKGYFYFNLKEEGYVNTKASDLCPNFKECEKGDITKKLPYKDEEFDLIISRDVAEHISEHQKFFQEQKRILKNGGRILVMTPNAKHMRFGDFYEDYTHVMPYTPKSMYEALIMNGFKKVKVVQLRAIPYLWKYSYKAFDFLFSRKKNNILALGIKDD
jgi:ubiquinone/menaquinone biosynthesis C-methylase UbiE